MKNHDEQVAKKLLDELENHPLTQQIRDEKRRVTIQERHAAAARIEALETERTPEIKRLRTDFERCEQTMIQAKLNYENALDAVRNARFELQSSSHNYDAMINTHREFLLSNYSPEIDEAIRFFNDKLSWLRGPGRVSHQAGGGTGLNAFTMKSKHVRLSNLNAVNQAMGYCQNAIQRLEGMKLQADQDADTIERLKSGIPSIDKYDENVIEREPIDHDPVKIRQMADGNDPGLVTRLLEKANDLMRKPAHAG